MPVYLFKRPDGRQVAIHRAMKDCPGDTFTCEDGVVALRDFAGEHSVEDRNPNWIDFKSVAMGCHPDQGPEFDRAYVNAGITDFHRDRDGNPHFHSKQAWKSALKVHGYVDFDGV